MAAELKVVRFDNPPLTDIPAMLRNLANQIEAGDLGEVQSLYALLPRNEDYPVLYGWGHVDGRYDPIIQLEMAKTWLLNNLVARS